MNKKNIADITTLSPAQEGMLYETILASEPGIHIEQSMYTLTGALDVAVFEQTWKWAIDRHAILRTSFVWKEQVEPLQVTLQRIPVPLAYQDWRGLSPEEQQQHIEETFQQERARGFELSRPPLMRLLLARLNEQSYYFFWTSHHILLDGWSQQILLDEILNCYRALNNGQPISRETSRPYSDYIAWLKKQDVTQAEQFWRAMLAGFTQTTPLGRRQEPITPYNPKERYRSARVQLSKEVSAALGQVAQHHHVTLSTIMRGIWALLLHHYSGNRDVVFGVTVSGRPEELVGIETMVGPFFNTLPLRVQVPSQTTLWSWLKELQYHTVEMHAYEYTSSGQVHQWSEMAGRSLLYESILVVENYPVSATAPGSGEMEVTAEVGSIQGAQTKYALTFLVVGGSRVEVQCVYNTSRFGEAAVEQIMAHFHSLLGTVATDPQVLLETLSRGLGKDEIPIVYSAQQEDPIEERSGEQAPRNPMEEMIAGMWGEVLDVAQVGRENHFFALGGHSLLAMQLLGRVRAILQVEVPLRALFEEPTVAGFARRVEHFLRHGEAVPLPPLVARARRQEVALSYAQQRLWFLDQLEPGSTTYLLPTALRVQGEIHARTLEQALEAVITRQESLRTTFEERAGQPMQIIHPVGSYTLPIIDLQGVRHEQRTQEAQELARQEAQHPCDLVQGPLLRTALLRLEPEEQVLLLTMHHIITDGWSTGIFVHEVMTLYRSGETGQPSALPALPLQYADYALWQREWLQGEGLQSHLRYWRETLAAVPFLELPTDHVRPTVLTHRGATQSFQVSARVSQAVKALSRQEHVTLFMLLLASLQVLLARYSGQEDISVGTTIANRQQAEIEGLIGFFVNTLVLRTDLSGTPTFTEVLQRVREVCLGAYAHQEVPFEQVVEELAPDRDLSRSPLFQVMLILQNTPQTSEDLADLQVTSLPIESHVSKFDLTFTIQETQDGLAGALEYNTDLFEASTITRLLGHWQTLLEGILDTPQALVGDLPLLTAQERDLLLVQWNATSTPSPHELGVHQLFEHQVHRTPEAVALVFEEETLTYACLNRRANQLAHYLQARGVGPEVLVGLCLQRSSELLVALLGVLKAGGAYVPLDPSYPSERLAFIVADANVALLLTYHLPDALQSVTHHIQTIDLENEKQAITLQRPETPDGMVSSQNLAYVMYTSGSTGRPKGTMVQHRNVSNFFTAMNDCLDGQKAGIWLAVTSISFDISVLELLWTLTRGFQVVVRPSLQEEVLWSHHNGRNQQEALAAQIQRLGITHLQCTPSQASLFLLDPELLTALGSVEDLLLGGEALPLSLLEQLSKVVVGEIHNMYGPTETTIWSTTQKMQKRPSSITIGRPIANTRIYILNTSLQLLPVGVPGELCIAGKGVTRGYLNRSDLTAEKFLPDPWSLEAGACLYRTGDVARYLPDGTIECLGRIDQQVKVRGYRIELGEIEARLAAHPTVQDAVVVVREDVAADKRLVAYVVLHPGQSVSLNVLRSHLQDRLPSYMLPAHMVVLDALPLTPNGKIDRKALPAPTWEQDEDAGLQRARTPIEELLVVLWSEVLGRSQIGIHDNFFELGGHSLLATQLLGRVRALLGREIALRALFEEPTVAGLARRLEQAILQDEVVALPPLVARARRQEVPLSYAQQRLWFLDQLEPESPAYLLSTALRVQGEIHARTLEQALEAVITRQESLRTTFEERAGQPLQIIHPVGSYTLPIIDLQGVRHEQRTQEAQKLARQEAQHPCDLVQGPLLRTALLRLEPEEQVLLLTMHHIITDGWSMGIFVHEVMTLYRSGETGQPSALPALPLQYADYALWQREWLQGEGLQSHLRYWRETLAAVPFLELPTDHVRPTVLTHRGATQSFQVSARVSQAVKALSRQEHVTLFMLLLASLQVLLARYSGQEDISVGTPIANRHQAEIEGLIGFFVNTLVLRTDLSGTLTFTEVLQRVREVCLGAYAHQEVPFEQVVEELAPDRDLSRSPLFQVMLILQNTPQVSEDLADLQVTSLPIESHVSKFDLTLSLQETQDRLVGALEYNTDLFEASTITRLLGHWQTLLEGILDTPQAPVGDLPLLTAQERDLLLVQWNATSTPSPHELGVHQLFEHQVHRTPEAVALVFEEETLTYACLNRRANQLAHYLQARGVGPEVLVGLCLQRSSELLVALLGVLKAGGAYVPLDPSYPSERLAFIVADANVALLLTYHLPDALQSVTHHIQTIDLENEKQAITLQRPETPDGMVSSQNLAYVMYTSGSTGRPKGTMVQHRNVSNFFTAMNDCLDGQKAGIWLAVTSISFDISVLELLWTLTRGFQVVVRPSLQEEVLWSHHNGRNQQEALAAQMQRLGITHLQCTPSQASLFLLDPELLTALGSVEDLLLGGEALPLSLLEQLSKVVVGEIHNMYGPTETTIWSTTQKMQKRPSSITIGRPIANTRIYILNTSLQLLPVGVPGELCIAGKGVTRGYLNRSDLTAEKFLPDPWSLEAGACLYRTGDVARYLPDGTIECLGRIDQQVKVRGYRIELGEIEAVLGTHPAIQNAVVIVQEDRSDNAHLLAYVVPDLLQAGAISQEEQTPLIRERLKHWQRLYDEIYQQGTFQTIQTFNTVGWNSSYTNRPIAPEEMQSWLEDTLALIRAYHPERVWEIGCGTGLLLFPLAPECTHYYGTDFSVSVLEKVRQHLTLLEKEDAAPATVTLFPQQADDFSNFPERPVDTILINSVVQYFPNVDYLLRVLEGAVRLVAPGGRIIVGDIRSFPLLEAFHASVQLHRASESLTRQQLWQYVQQHVQHEEELTIDPTFFWHWAQNTQRVYRIEVRLKRGWHQNELTRFRYQVVLHVGEPRIAERIGLQHAKVENLNWSEQKLTRDLLQQKLIREQPERLRLRQVPNARVDQAIQTLCWLKGELGPETAGAWRTELDTQTGNGMEPEELYEHAERLGYQVTISWRQQEEDGSYTALLQRKDGEQWIDAEEELLSPTTYNESVGDWHRYANEPLQAEMERHLVPQIRQYLQEQLPAYMIPSNLVILKTLPLTPNGKVDRRRLSTLEEIEGKKKNEVYERPRTPIEELIGKIWCEVLGLTQSGIHDHFFESGGHSLLATQLVARIRAIVRVEVPLRVLFEAPTLAEFARRVERMVSANAGIEKVPMQVSERSGDTPLSFAQQRLWFLDQLEPESPAYLLPTALRVQGEIHARTLEQALEAVITRQESLRTTFEERAGQPLQIIHPIGSYTLPIIDLQGVRHEQRTQEAQKLARQEAQHPCDLGQGPLLRTALLRLEPEEQVLLVTMHHIITDGWSMGIFVHEVMTLYRSFEMRQPSALPALPLQYADYALWQRDWLQGEVLQIHLRYWHETLAAVPFLELPTDHPRPVMQTFRGAVQSLRLPVSLSQAVKALSRQEHVTLFMLLLASLQVLLARYSGQEDISVGTPIANRHQAEIEGLIGFFVNTLVLRTDLSGTPAFTEVLQRVREVCLGAYAHQEVPFEQVVEELAPDRNLSRSPLFQVMLVLQNIPQTSEDLAGLQVTSLPIESHVSKFDLTFTIQETQDGLAGALEYNTDLFEASTITRLLGHWQTLLEGIVDTPQALVGDLPLLTAQERDLLLVQWNATSMPSPHELGVHQLFEHQVHRTPEAVALVFEEETLTYACLNRRANQLAHHLQARGVGPEVLVGLCLQRSSELLVALLGVLKAGGAYVPLDPSSPSERLISLLQDCHLPLILTQESLRACLPSANTLCLDTQWEAYVSQNASDNPVTSAEADNLVYLIYTSGSTGHPKGVMNTHRGLHNRLLWMQHTYRLTPVDRVLQKTPFYFDVSVWEFFWPLITGACLVVALPGGHQDPTYLKTILMQQQITTLHFVPAMLQSFLQEPGVEACRSVRQVFSSGEALATEVQTRFFTRFSPRVGLHNLYGPTEASIDVTFWACQAMEESGPVPIGRPIANTQIYLLDRALRPVPIGVIGDLYIAGVGLARGYYEQADLTADKFLANPFAQEEGSRLYKTGDLARFRRDGAIDYIGRSDQQVKVRGYRIELGEIEARLAAHPTVQDAVVVVREDVAADKRLVAYVVLHPGQSLSLNALRSHLQDRLPSYMLPTHVVVLDALPLTPNGKIDRKALPAPTWEQDEDAGLQRARTPMQEVVEGLWSEVLGHSQIGIHDNFFELGGHSLLATQLIARVRKMLEVEMPLRSVFEAPTVIKFAQYIERELRKSKGLQIPPLVAGVRPEEIPLSFAQQRLWFLDQLEWGSTAYLLPNALYFIGDLNIKALDSSLEELLSRHEILRTIFVGHIGQPVQIIHPAKSYCVPIIDLQGIRPHEQVYFEQHLTRQEAQNPCDLTKGPLLRMKVLRLHPQEHIVLLTLHHIITDGWSNEVLVRELTMLYRAFVTEQPSLLEPLPIQYVDYTLWQQQWLQGGVLDTLLDYWANQLSGAHLLELPTDQPRKVHGNNFGAIHAFKMSSELYQSLMILSHEESVTLFMTLLAAFQILLHRYSGQEDIVIGTDIANRTSIETEQMIGFFVNLLVLRLQLSQQESFRELLKRVRTMVLDAYANQDLPFEKLVDALQLDRNSHRIPFINVLFVLQNMPQYLIELPGLTVSPIEVQSDTAKFDVAIFLMEEGQGLTGYVNYRTDLFHPESIARLIRHFEVLLQSIVISPGAAIEKLEMRTETEKHQKLIKEIEKHEKQVYSLKSAKRRKITVTPEN